MKKRALLISSIVVELIILVTLAIKGFPEKTYPNSSPSIVNISKDSLDNNHKSQLLYYYEPQANQEKIENIEWLPYKPTYTINSDGLNERYNYLVQKPDNTFRIITLGDSFTFGNFINTNDNWTEKIEELLNSKDCYPPYKVEVINLGVFGYDIEYSVERYRLKGKKYNPDLVIWYLKDDDFSEIKEKTTPLINEYIEKLKNGGSYEKLIAGGNKDVFYNSWLYATEKVNESFGKKNIIDYQQKLLKQFTNLYAKNTIIINNTYFSKDYRDILTTLEHEKKFIIFENALKNYDSKSDSFEPYDAHPNKNGHEKIAKSIFDFLISRKLVSCK